MNQKRIFNFQESLNLVLQGQGKNEWATDAGSERSPGECSPHENDPEFIRFSKKLRTALWQELLL